MRVPPLLCGSDVPGRLNAGFHTGAVHKERLVAGFPLEERCGPRGGLFLVGDAGERFGQGEEFHIRPEQGA